MIRTHLGPFCTAAWALYSWFGGGAGAVGCCTYTVLRLSLLHRLRRGTAHNTNTHANKDSIDSVICGSFQNGSVDIDVAVLWYLGGRQVGGSRGSDVPC